MFGILYERDGGQIVMRIAAAIIGAVAAISLYAQWVVSSGLLAGSSPLAVIWRMAGYFTVLSNLGVVLIMASAAYFGKIRARRAGLITVVMVMVGLGYHLLLAGIWQPTGLAWWADQGLHTAVPVLTTLWWVIYAPKAGLHWSHAFSWLIWPIVYADYALIRGLASGFYPYPFVDVAVLGIMQVALNIAALAAIFSALALVLIGTARVMR